ncbi:hypothetical protein SERLA73DRAFT_84238 [Serpula lacrymans var. lacrymans S7.3]|uniref:separase n=1 Tax=Serpula lacrymans var. lacrymans (strain S7.3) TaxID=936435 RepID=F8PLA9_SERL3|nr:hypothetical protein SERLA73DRAFT_84238 [Serpula lacrymans var. lacrymans S7.3]
MGFAKRGGDLCLLDRITGYIQNVQKAESSVAEITSQIEKLNVSSPLSSEHKLDTAFLEGAKICAVFMKATASIEREATESAEAIALMPRYISFIPNGETDSTSNGSPESTDLQRVIEKLQRAMERLRRAAVKLLESQRGKANNCLFDLLEPISGALEKTLAKESNVDIATSALDTLFVLARHKLKSADPDTYSPSLDLLMRSANLVAAGSNMEDIDSGRLEIPLSARANYTRCISGAFHNLAGTLYQDSKYAGAVRFLKQACALGGSALRMRAQGLTKQRTPIEGKTIEDRPSEEKDQEAWKQLEEQLTRRWELLGICYTKIGDRKLAHESFVQSVKTFPYASSNFVQHAKIADSTGVFATTPALKQIGIIIERISYLGACELFLDASSLSLRQALSSGSWDFDAVTQAQIIGMVLERQVECLESSLWKDDVKSAVRALLEDALCIYEKSQMPIRRARVLIRCLEFLWKDNGSATKRGGSINWDSEEIGSEALVLLSVEQLGEDEGQAPYRSQYRAAACFWLSLLAYREPNCQTSLVTHHAEEGCKFLKAMIQPAVSEPSPKAKRVSGPLKKSPKQTTTLRKNHARTASVRQTKAKPTRGAARDPITPQPRKALEKLSTNASKVAHATVGETTNAIKFQSVDKLLDPLQMVIQLLGLHGLVLLKVKLLVVARRLCEQQAFGSKDGNGSVAFILTSVDLAHEHLKLGKLKRANAIFNQCLSIIKTNDVSDDVRVRLLLRYAEALAIAGNVLGSASSYCEALGLSERLMSDEKGVPSAQRIRTRVGRLERAAMASYVFSVIQFSKDNVVLAMECMLQSLRLWNRAIDALARASDVALDRSKVKKNTYSRRILFDGMEWRMAEGLLSTLFALIQAYFARGSAREAEYFAQQAHDMAESLNTQAMASRALARKGEIQLHQGQIDTGHESLLRAAELLADLEGTDAADIRRLRGDFSQISGEEKDPRQLYKEAATMIAELEKNFASLDGSTSPRKSGVGSSPRHSISGTAQETVVPVLLSAILRQHIWLLRDDVDDEYQAMLEKLIALPPSPETKAEENALMGKLTLHDVYGQFRADMFLNSLAESTISLPVGMSGEKAPSFSASTQDIVSTLDNAEELFWADLILTARRGKVSHVRNAAVSLAIIKALQTSLGKPGKEGPVLVARLLDASTAITLHREIMETIQHKFPDVQRFDDLQWPLMTPNGSPLPRPIAQAAKTRLRALEGSDDGDNDTTTDDKSLKEYWEAILSRYESHTLDTAALSTSRVDSLPDNWTVVNITITEDKNTMFVCRQRARSDPLIFCVPLKGRRETDDDEHLTFDDALNELKEIIRLSDQGTRQAAHVKKDDQKARTAWWADRSALDKRMQELLENIEYCWLGAFKTILSEPTKIPRDIISDFRAHLDRVFKRSLPAQDRKQKSKVTLDDNLLECFSTLSPKCRDEELEDLVYFILDLYQFHGIPIAISEVDVDQVTVDLRTALEEHAARAKARVVPKQDSHLFLVLDKNVQGIPWESIPILRGRSVSRIPNMECLMDKLQFAEWQRSRGETANEAMATEIGTIDRVKVDPRKAYYVLNPSGDLKGTEGRFASWLGSMREVGWEGVIGRPPSEQQFLDALTRKDLVIYFGHGGGEQYVRSHRIRHLPRCAATMLWGCSSGALKDMGDFDRVGTPYNYMLAGCPSLVANLWDVTDRDIDKFSQVVFDKLQLTADGVRKNKEGEQGGTSLVAAVSQARDSCKLRYLTGAAPVVYGIPFYL